MPPAEGGVFRDYVKAMVGRYWIYVALSVISIAGMLVHSQYGFSHADHSGAAYGTDDAFISYRYALNFVNGEGLVFNPGEQPVEGFSNPLYVLAIALVTLIMPDQVYAGSVALNIALMVGFLIVFARILEQWVGGRLSLWGFALICASPLLWAVPGTGLETAGVLFIQAGLVWATLSSAQRDTSVSRGILILLVAASVLIRVDGFILPLVCAAILVAVGSRRSALVLAVATASTAAATVAARLLYYGEPLPNTVYAKVTGGIGDRLLSALGQLGNLVEQSAFYLYLVPLVFGLIAGWRLYRLGVSGIGSSDTQAISKLMTVTSVVGVVLLGYWFFIGGDTYVGRFILLLIPLGVLLTVWTIQVCAPTSSSWVTAMMVLFIVAQLSVFVLDPRFEYRVEKYDRYIELGHALADGYPGATIAVDAAGKVPYLSGLETIDMLGLNDHTIARTPAREFLVGHSKYDPQYVLGRKPDLIMAWSTNEKLDLAWGLSRDVYTSAGYAPLYMLNGTAGAATYNIMAVAGGTDEELATLRRLGYWIVVLGSNELVETPY